MRESNFRDQALDDVTKIGFMASNFERKLKKKFIQRNPMKTNILSNEKVMLLLLVR